MKASSVLLTGTLLLGAAAFASANTLAGWTFENCGYPDYQAPNTWLSPVSAVAGSGLATAWHSTGSVFDSYPGNGSSGSLTFTNGWSKGDFYQLSASTLGYKDISISFDQTGTSQAPSRWLLEYSIDGSSYTAVGTDYSLGSASWNESTRNSASTFSFDLSSFTDLNNAATVYFRIVDDSTTAIGGYSTAIWMYQGVKLDNVVVSAATPIQPVPEPALPSLAVLGCIGIVIANWRQRTTPAR
jgi:hypothetical protein